MGIRMVIECNEARTQLQDDISLVMAIVWEFAIFRYVDSFMELDFPKRIGSAAAAMSLGNGNIKFGVVEEELIEGINLIWENQTEKALNVNHN